MKRNKLFVVPMMVFFLPVLVFSQEEKIPAISKSELMKHVFFLASDSLQGRGFNSQVPALEIAADYISESAKNRGLRSMNEGYSQNFEVNESARDIAGSFLKIIDNKKEQVFSGNDFVVIGQTSENVELEGQVYYTGFGWNDETGSEMPPDESFQDKIVMVAAGTPETFSDNASHIWNNSLEHGKAEKIFNAGARAVILVTGTPDEGNKAFRHFQRLANRTNYSLKKTIPRNNPLFIITVPEVADAIFGGKGKWQKTLKKTVKKNKPVSATREKRLHLKSVRHVTPKTGRNIFGFVEGSDPALKKECVLFTAHYDHLGVNPAGEIFNGADDNASGTATLLEVAAAFAGTEEKPKRSVAFLWAAAEEVGLIGSEFYSANPLFPLEKTVACINLDMVGRVYEPRDSVWSHSPKQVKPFGEIYALLNDFDPELKEITEKAAAGLQITADFSLSENFFYSSDHYHFHRNKVPILNLSTGYSADYHRTTDDAERIDFDKMKKVAELCYLVGTAIAGN